MRTSIITAPEAGICILEAWRKFAVPVRSCIFCCLRSFRARLACFPRGYLRCCSACATRISFVLHLLPANHNWAVPYRFLVLMITLQRFRCFCRKACTGLAVVIVVRCQGGAVCAGGGGVYPKPIAAGCPPEFRYADGRCFL